MERVYPETHGHIVHIFGICITKRELPSPHLLKSSQGLANRVPAVQIAIHCSHFMGVTSLQVIPIQLNIVQWGFILAKRYICMVYVLWRRYHALLHGRQWIILANLEKLFLHWKPLPPGIFFVLALQRKNVGRLAFTLVVRRTHTTEYANDHQPLKPLRVPYTSWLESAAHNTVQN